MVLKFNVYEAPDYFSGWIPYATYSKDNVPVGIAPNVPDVVKYVTGVICSADNTGETEVSLMSNPFVTGSKRIPAHRLEKLLLDLKEQLPDVKFSLE